MISCRPPELKLTPVEFETIYSRNSGLKHHTPVTTKPGAAPVPRLDHFEPPASLAAKATKGEIYE